MVATTLQLLLVKHDATIQQWPLSLRDLMKPTGPLEVISQLSALKPIWWTPTFPCPLPPTPPPPTCLTIKPLDYFQFKESVFVCVCVFFPGHYSHLPKLSVSRKLLCSRVCRKLQFDTCSNLGARRQAPPYLSPVTCTLQHVYLLTHLGPEKMITWNEQQFLAISCCL